MFNQQPLHLKYAQSSLCMSISLCTSHGEIGPKQKSDTMIIHETEVGDDEYKDHFQMLGTTISVNSIPTYLFVFVYYSIMILLRSQKA